MATATEASPLETLRERAWETFRATPAPAKTIETWRRVDFGAWNLGHLAAERADADGAPELSAELGGAGVELTTIERAVEKDPDSILPHLRFSAAEEFKKLEAANLAGFSGGLFLRVPKGAKLAQPIDLSFFARREFSFPRALIVVEDGAEATIVESHRRGVREPERGSTVAFSKLVVGAGAKVKFFYEQSQGPTARHFWHQQAELGQDAFLQHYNVFLGAAVHKSELDVRLRGKGARSELYGVLLGGGRQLFDPHTVQWHQAPNTSSDLSFRVALMHKARSIYTGLIRIEKDAPGSEAFQRNNNLLLSNDARADSTPVLEILTDDVRCKHGATVGPVNAEELFYLCSRGLEPAEATRMLVMGFLDSILSRLPLERMQAEIPASIEEKLR